MKFIIDLILHNPIFKIIGIFLILYFGLYTNKEHPDSLGNRLSKEKMQENFKEVKSNSYFIVENLRKAEELEAAKKNKNLNEVQESSETQEIQENQQNQENDI